MVLTPTMALELSTLKPWRLWYFCG